MFPSICSPNGVSSLGVSGYNYTFDMLFSVSVPLILYFIMKRAFFSVNVQAFYKEKM